MTQRARLYLLFAGVRSLATAVILMALGWDKVSKLYPYVIDPLPLWSWIVIWTGIGALLSYAAARRSQQAATVGLILIVTVTAVWAVGVSATYFINPTLGTLSSVLWWALVAKDLIQIRQPLSSPFEDLVKHYETE